VARALAQTLSERIGQGVVVEQKVGGNTNVGSAFVSRAEPDGYTLLVNTDTLTSNATVYARPGYDVVSGFEPISLLATAPGALAVRKDLGVSTVAEFAELVRRKGKGVSVASTGTGTVSHLTALLFRQSMGLPEWTDVPYQGAAKAVTDLLGGHVDAIFATIVPLAPYLKSGEAKILAVTTRIRAPAFPDIPTVAEQAGLADFDVSNWVALLAPAGTPKPIVDRLAEETAKALRQPETADKLRASGLEPDGSGPQELARTIRQNVTLWGGVAQKAGLRVD
jgi:tripartite-type tricarboxylate transporter receptor subunit TctC